MDKRFFAGLNLAEVFEGQNVNPILELEIETYSILDASTGLAI